MRRLALLLVLSLLALVPPARAQDDDDPGSAIAQGFVQILREELQLRDDQIPRVSEALEKGFAQLMANMDARKNGADPDDDAVKDAIVADLKTVLDESQSGQLDILVKEFETQTGRFEMGTPDDLTPENLLLVPDEKAVAKADVWFEGELPSAERLLLKAEDVLLLSEEEKKIVLPRVKAVVLARRALHDGRHERRKNLGLAMKGGAKEDEIKERVHDFRDKTIELEGRLEKAEADLREVVTIDQEARLVAIGILD
jgi:hypothetical protein